MTTALLPMFTRAAAVTVALWMTAPLAHAAPEGRGLTREEVMAEYWRARAAGELPSPSQIHGPLLSQALAESMGAGPARRTASAVPLGRPEALR